MSYEAAPVMGVQENVGSKVLAVLDGPSALGVGATGSAVPLFQGLISPPPPITNTPLPAVVAWNWRTCCKVAALKINTLVLPANPADTRMLKVPESLIS